MCESLKTEILDLRARLAIVEHSIVILVNESLNCKLSSDEELIRDDQIRLLEKDRDELEARINKLLELRQYQMLCEHEFVTDLIDHTPDTSMTIVYCKNCMYVR